MTKTSYDPEADAFAVWFAPEGVQPERAAEVAPGVFVDFGADGCAIGVEMLSARSRIAGTCDGARREREAVD